jgi:hypothetical protein
MIGPHGVDHFGFVVMTLGDLKILMAQHGHCQSYLCPVMEGSAGRKARSDQMRIDSFEIAAEQTKERRLHLAILPDWCSPRIDGKTAVLRF